MAMDLERLKKFLCTNAMKAKWEVVVHHYTTDKRAHDAKVTKSGDTALHLAVSDSQEAIVERLLKVIQTTDKAYSKKLLEIKNDRSLTPLHIAAILGNVKMCYDIASVDSSLVSVQNNDGETPLFLAALHGNKDAFLCLNSFCSSKNPDEVSLNCRRTKDGQNILHCAIMGEFFDLAFHIIKLYKELVNWNNVIGFSPLHILATKPSSFKSGSHFERWKMLIYYCIFVDPLKFDPNSYRRILESTETLAPQTKQLTNENCYPNNYMTCSNICNLLWKGIQVVSAAMAKKKKTPRSEGKDSENPENQGHEYVFGPQGYDFLPENYSTCFNFFKLFTKTFLVIIGLGFVEIKKIEGKKKKHARSLQVMNILLECASMYEYEDNGNKPEMATMKEGTQPYSIVGGGVTFLHNIIENQTQHPQRQLLQPPFTVIDNINTEGEKNGQDRKQGSTNVIAASKNDIAENILQNRKGNECESQLKEPYVLIAAKNGVVEMVEKILELFPMAIHETNIDEKNIVLLAVENRQPHVYQLLLKRNILRQSIFRKVDREGNSALHLAAKLGDHKPWLIPGAALQMQWELRWYKFVKESMPVDFFTRYNDKGKTPKAIFTETHKELVKTGGEWLTNTSESCSVVAALIATVAFATSATVPGGNDQIKGTPILEKQPAFDVFAVASLIALCSSVTSVVMFLAILTSRFEERDFGSSIPRKLLLGLSTLFVSIAAMLVSFSAGHFFVLKDRLKYAAWPVYALTCLPVTLFAFAQFPLYFDLVWATFKKIPQRSYTVVLSS